MLVVDEYVAPELVFAEAASPSNSMLNVTPISFTSPEAENVTGQPLTNRYQ